MISVMPDSIVFCITQTHPLASRTASFASGTAAQGAIADPQSHVLAESVDTERGGGEGAAGRGVGGGGEGLPALKQKAGAGVVSRQG